MTPPKHIWSGNWRDESDAEARRRQDAEVAAGEQVPPPPPTRQVPPAAPPFQEQPQQSQPPQGQQSQQPDPPRKRSRGLGPVGIALVAVLAGAGGAAGTIAYHEGTDNPSALARPASSLPSSTSAAARPKKGQTIANAVYQTAGPAVVSIRTASGSGTGFLIDDKGTLVTNEHVIEASQNSRVKVSFGTNGAVLSGKITGADPSSDLAVVSISPSDIPKGVKPLKFANSDGLQVGDQVIAIGNPFGLDRTLTTGVISSLGRSITAPNNFQIDGAIQTDAAINPGNSGGPLLDVDGNVVGINSQIATGSQYSQGNVGIGFAVPSNTARMFVPELQAGKTVEHAWLGVETAPTDAGVDGVRIIRLNAGGPAQRDGLKVGDVVTAIDGQELKSPTDLPAIINAREPRTTIKLSVMRDGARKSIPITLGVRPKNP